VTTFFACIVAGLLVAAFFPDVVGPWLVTGAAITR